MRFTRRRSDRPGQGRFRLESSLEKLESRELLSGSGAPFAYYLPSDLLVYSAPQPHKLPYSIEPQVVNSAVNPQNSLLNNEGKVVSGRDRQGNEWAITVHGPGYAIVSDTTPNDGVLDDDINTIQLVGTNINTTYVTGSVVASAYTPTDGTVLFRQLIDTSGVKSVELNGFSLTSLVTPTPTVEPTTTGVNPSLYQTTGIYLTGGVGTLAFANILAPIDLSNPVDVPINIIIGDPSTPLKQKTNIQIDSIFNTVYVSGEVASQTIPITSPTVSIVVNGQIGTLSLVSTTQHPVTDPTQAVDTFSLRQSNPTLSPIFGAGEQSSFSIVGTTGRTSVQATSIDQLNVAGSAKNLTVSRGTPFKNGLSGLTHLKKATFGGNADAVGIDVSGTIGSVTFKKGLGDPTGVAKAVNAAGQKLPETNYGIPLGQTGYPAAGLLGGQVTATKIKHVKANAANVTLQTASNPAFISLNSTGSPTYYPANGDALTSAAIVSSGSIGSVTISGSQINSEIKSGFDYPSAAAGLEGTRAKSKIGPLHQAGDQVNSVTSATYRPDVVYGSPLSQKGQGKIRGNLKGTAINTGSTTALGNQGAGFFARKKTGGNLPPTKKVK
jgi:hypothetical protein